MKKILTLLTVISLVTMILLSFAACGEDSKEQKADGTQAAETTSVSETTTILETTEDGGTIEQDSEGNKITKDTDGNVISVEDKSGNPVDVEEYITTHSWVIVNNDPQSSGSNDGSDQKATPKDISSKQSSSNDGSNKTNAISEKQSENSQIEQVEESIPVVIATMPDEDEMIEFPDF